MMTFLYCLLAAVPIVLFIVYLRWIDSFALTSAKRLVLVTLAGAACYLVAAFWLGHWSEKFAAPIVDEVCKGVVLLAILRWRNVVLLGNATIYGAAIGAGFALSKSFVMISVAQEMTALESFAVGLEEAVMHVGCTSTLAMMLVMIWQNRFGGKPALKNLYVVLAFALTALIHFIHENAPIPEAILLVIMVAYFLLSKRSLFKKNERYIHHWIDDCINNEIALLGSIKRGELKTTKAGQYMLTLKDGFKPEVFFDMCCYVSVYLELSIASKSNLILKEAGLPTQPVPDSKAKVKELHALRKSIGRAGESAIAPIVQIKAVDRWVVDSLI